VVVEAGAPAVDGHGAVDEQRARVGRAGEVAIAGTNSL
jgi:hypothetical protein